MAHQLFFYNIFLGYAGITAVFIGNLFWHANRNTLSHLRKQKTLILKTKWKMANLTCEELKR